MRLSTAVVAAFAVLTAAHPGEDHHAEMLERRDFLSSQRRTNLDHCATKHRARGIDQRGIERRSALAKKMSKRGIIQRAPEDINKSHLSTAEFDESTPLGTVFANNASCVLSPEETEGPYYVSGEYVRSDISEDQVGVPLWVDVAVFDVETCEPVTEKWLEVWHCNSTGIYGGVNAGGNFTSAPENLLSTFSRGLQKTNADGAVQFKTTFPGHYVGRTQHIHVIVHSNATERANGTVLSTNATHVGQMYFDQSLADSVELLEPYTSNEQALTTNVEDQLLLDGLASSDPIMEYVLLGETVADGVLAWLSFGVNTTYVKEVHDAATYYEGGGVQNEPNPTFGGGPPPGPPSTSSAAATNTAS